MITNYNFDNMPFDVHYHINSFLEKHDLEIIKFVSLNQHSMAHQTIYRCFEQRVKILYPNGNVTPEQLLKKVLTFLKIKPPDNCNKFEWLNSIMIDKESIISKKALEFLSKSKISYFDSFECYPLFEIVPSTFIEENHNYDSSDIAPYLKIEIYSKERYPNHLARSIWQVGIQPISKKFIYTENGNPNLTIFRNPDPSTDHFHYNSHFILPLRNYTHPDFVTILDDKILDLTPNLFRTFSILSERVQASTPLGQISIFFGIGIALWFFGIKID